MSDNLWSEIKLELAEEFGELVAEILFEEGAGGVVYDEPDLLAKQVLQCDEIPSQSFLAQLPKTYGLRAYLPVDDRLGERLSQIKERLVALLGYLPEIKLKQIQEEDWAEAWKAYFKPEKNGKIVIKPSWEAYESQRGEIVVELDPGMAFGTGSHPTTHLCVQLLQKFELSGRKVLDLGTGSGILAIVAAKLGATEILATDLDPLAVKIARINIERNQLNELIQTKEGNLLSFELETKYDLVVANIIASAIVELIPDLQKVLEPNGVFLASGIIVERQVEVVTVLEVNGFAIEAVVEQDGWVAIKSIFLDFKSDKG